MLDHAYPDLHLSENDSNMYILDELSGHSVVLGHLPGSKGKGAAAMSPRIWPVISTPSSGDSSSASGEAFPAISRTSTWAIWWSACPKAHNAA